MKRFISLIMVMIVSVFLSESVVAKASDSDSYDNIREKMILYGMPEQIVKELPDSIILKYANITEDSVQKYYYRLTEGVNPGTVSVYNMSNDLTCMMEEITEEECMAAIASLNFVQPCTEDTIKESYLQINISAIPIEEGTRRYIVSATYQWLTLPTFKSEDYFALTVHDSMVIVPDTEYTVEQNNYVYLLTGSTVHNNYWTDSLCKSGIGGHCMSVHLLNNTDQYTYYNFRGYLSYEAEIAEVGPTGIVNYAAYATYAHRKLSFNMNVLISLPPSAYATITPTTSFAYMRKQNSWVYEE